MRDVQTFAVFTLLLRESVRLKLLSSSQFTLTEEMSSGLLEVCSFQALSCDSEWPLQCWDLCLADFVGADNRYILYGGRPALLSMDALLPMLIRVEP